MLGKDPVKRVVWVIHRRGGKDKTMFNAVVCKAAQTKANYAYYFPTAALGYKALWSNIDARTGMKVIEHAPKELVSKINESRMEITLVNGSTIRVLGTDNLDVVGGNYYGTVWSETAQQNPLAWDLTRPILAENGGWAWFNGTPRGRNWFFTLKNMAQSNPEWFCEVLPVDVTGAISEADIQAERNAGMSEEMIRQEFYCDFSIGFPGAIYAELVEKQRQAGRISDDIIYLPGHPVYTVWDIGAAANTKCWVVQVIGDRIKLLEALSGGVGRQTPADWAKVLLGKRDYRYGAHILPHDGEVIWRKLMDDAGFQVVKVLNKPASEFQNIDTAKANFARCDFNARECKEGLASLEAWQTKLERDGKTLAEKPVHDWSSHFSTAFGYVHQALRDNVIHDKFNIGGGVHIDVDFDYDNTINSNRLRPSKSRGQVVYDQEDVM